MGRAYLSKTTLAFETFEARQMLSADPVRFAVIGDFGDNSRSEADVARLVSSHQPDFVITAGDNSYLWPTTYEKPIGNHYGAYLAGGDRPENAFFPATGNHDYIFGIAPYLAYFDLPGAGIQSSNTSGTERYYDFVQGPVHFFAIDSYAARISEVEMLAQQQWLQTQMMASQSQWQIVYFHHSPYSSALHGSDELMQWPFEDWGADAVISGHDHTYERFAVGDIPYFVNGLGGRSIYYFNWLEDGSQVNYNDDYGAMIVDADDDAMTFRFVNLSGDFIDCHTVPAGDTIPASIDAQVTDGRDDVEQSLVDGSMDLSSRDLELVNDPPFNGLQTVGIRFQDIRLPRGATITSAHLELVAREASAQETNVTIWAQDIDDAAAFSNTDYDLTNRPRTLAAVDWIIPAWETIGVAHQSPDLASVVQEIVSRPGWNSGNDLAFIISGTGRRTAEAYEGEAGLSARLHVEYTTVLDTPPAAWASTVTTTENRTHVFSTDDFRFSDAQCNQLVSVMLQTPENVGQLKLSGVNVLDTQTVSRLDLDAGLLTYEPQPNASGLDYDSFSFIVNDAGLGTVAATMTLNVVLPGDFNGDGTVFRGDVPRLARNFGLASGSVRTTGDANGDGMTDLQDLAILRRNFGNTVSPSPSAAAPSAAQAPSAGALLVQVSIQQLRSTLRQTSRLRRVSTDHALTAEHSHRERPAVSSHVARDIASRTLPARRRPIADAALMRMASEVASVGLFFD